MNALRHKGRVCSNLCFSERLPSINTRWRTRRSGSSVRSFVDETTFFHGDSRAEKPENQVTPPPAAMSGFEASARNHESSARTAVANVFFRSLMRVFAGTGG